MVYLELLRVRQWTKNFFMVFPLIFSGGFLHPALWLNCATAFIGFCFLSSGMYVVNDLVDLEKDRLHHRKCHRPLSSGAVGVPVAVAIAVILLALGFGISVILSRDLLFLAMAYVLLHTLYNLRTKRVVLLDVLTIAFGFQIRIWAGSVAVGVLPSVWLQICVLVLALFLGFTKRRGEMTALKDRAADHRSVLGHYSLYLLDQIIMVCSTLAIVFYSLYTISPDVVARLGGRHDMLYSVGFVIYGVFRYLYLVHVKNSADDPSEVLLKDAPILINIALWIGFVMGVLYMTQI